MATVLAFPILGALVILQSAIASRVTLLQGSADLVLLAVIAWAIHPKVESAWQWAVIGGLLVNIPSAMPLGIPLIGYLVTTGLALLLRQRVWQVPVLAMLSATFLGSLVCLGLDWAVLRFLGTPLPLGQSFYLVILPATLINLLLAVPFFAFAGDLAARLYPAEIEI